MAKSAYWSYPPPHGCFYTAKRQESSFSHIPIAYCITFKISYFVNWFFTHSLIFFIHPVGNNFKCKSNIWKGRIKKGKLMSPLRDGLIANETFQIHFWLYLKLQGNSLSNLGRNNRGTKVYPRFNGPHCIHIAITQQRLGNVNWLLPHLEDFGESHAEINNDNNNYDCAE